MPIHTKPKPLGKMLEKGNWVTAVQHQNMRNWVRHYGDYQFNGFIAHVIITTKKVLVRLKDIWEEDVPQAVDQGANRIIEVKRELEETFSWPGHQAFRLGNWKRRNAAVVRGSHQAIIHHPLAEKCNDLDYSIAGKQWSVDASKGIPEAEATEPGFSTDDADFEHQDLEWRTRNQVGVRQLKGSIDDMMSFLEKSTQLQNSLTQQIQSLFQSDNNVM
ncbi:MAG: hypothetical protein ACFFBD_18260 [Candidatus Hodarchaeota archaeon]